MNLKLKVSVFWVFGLCPILNILLLKAYRISVDLNLMKTIFLYHLPTHFVFTGFSVNGYFYKYVDPDEMSFRASISPVFVLFALIKQFVIYRNANLFRKSKVIGYYLINISFSRPNYYLSLFSLDVSFCDVTRDLIW